MSPESPRVISLGHGSGGRLTQELIRTLFLRHFESPLLALGGDSALLTAEEGPLAITTDSFVVTPLVFAGGDIGSLAVHGSVNDLAVAGAVPRFLTAAFILEEGLEWGVLDRIAESMARAARACSVQIVAGDTKVVDRGHGDGVFITTTGLGRLRAEPPPGALSAAAGDAVLVSGSIGDHGAVIGAMRSGFGLADLQSDSASVFPCVDALYRAGLRPRFMRDPTRGGLVTVLAEFCGESGTLSVRLDEASIPVRDSVRTVCAMLGLDPLYLACEGRVVVILPPEQAEAGLAALRSAPGGEGAMIIGRVVPPAPSPVVLATRYGGTRLYDMLASEPLPRIC